MSNTTVHKSRKGWGRREANYAARPKAGKPGKYEMYLKSLRQHDRMNFSGQFTSAMGIIGQTAAHELMALEVVKTAEWVKNRPKCKNDLTDAERKLSVAQRRKRKSKQTK